MFDFDEVVKGGFHYGGVAHIGGAWRKHFLISNLDNRRYLFKPGEKHGEPRPHVPEADYLSYRVAALLFPPDQYISIRKTIFDYGIGPVLGSVQPYLEDAVGCDFRWSGDSTLSFLSDQDIQKVQREHIRDWLTSNHDAHGGQWLRLANGNLLGIDKSQAMKHFGEDHLDEIYHPNAPYGEDVPLYHLIFKAAHMKLREAKFSVIKPVLERARTLSDTEFLDCFDQYLSVGKKKRKPIEIALVERKNNLAHDFKTYYRRMTEEVVL